MDLEEQRWACYLTIANVVVLLAGAFVAMTGFLLSPAGLEERLDGIQHSAHPSGQFGGTRPGTSGGGR